MTIKRYTANKDNTITNAFKANLTTRGTGSNMGESDVLEVFSIYGQSTATSREKARILVEFPIDKIRLDRTSGVIPASGSVMFYLRLSNARHSSTTPSLVGLQVRQISGSWNEGTGLDMETYRDYGVSNWVERQTGDAWETAGGDLVPLSRPAKVRNFNVTGSDDIEVEVSWMVEEWLSTNSSPTPPAAPQVINNGFLISLQSDYENASRSYYTKKFFARGSENFFKRPTLEARWNSSSQDTSALPDPYVKADEYIFNITNLKSSYKAYEKTTFKVHTRKKDWQPNIYTVASNQAPLDLVDEVYYKITRVSDNYKVVGYSTASLPTDISHGHTTPVYSKLSYNSAGSFFDFDMSNLEPNYLYEISFLRRGNGLDYIEQKEKFKFRVNP